jgi:hypothetical protein
MTYNYTGGVGTVATYLNGVQVSTGTTAAATTPAFDELSFGCGNSSANQHVLSIDDVSLWSDALSAPQLLAAYNAPEFGGALADYGAGDMSLLFGLYNAGSGSATVGSLTWKYATGLSGSAGSVWQTNGVYYMQLGDDGTGLETAAALKPGDANGDGRVDINDLTVVLTNFDQTGMTWSQGDFTGDGKVDINDLTIVLTNFGTSSATGIQAVPEPAGVVLFVIGAVGLVGFAWRRQAKR